VREHRQPAPGGGHRGVDVGDAAVAVGYEDGHGQDVQHGAEPAAFVLHRRVLAGQRLLGLFLVVDVGGRAEPFDDLAGFASQRNRSAEEPTTRAVLLEQTMLDLVMVAGLDRPLPRGGGSIQVFGVQQVPPALAAGLLDAQARTVGHLIVVEVHPSVGLGGPDDLGQGLGQGAESGLAFPKLLLHLATLGRVMQDQQMPARHDAESCTNVEVGHLAVRTDDLHLAGIAAGLQQGSPHLVHTAKGADELRHGASDQFVGLQAQRGISRGVDLYQTQIIIHDHDAVGRGFENRPELTLALLEYPLGPLEIVDVGTTRDPPGYRTVVSANGPPSPDEPPVGPRPGPEAKFNLESFTAAAKVRPGRAHAFCVIGVHDLQPARAGHLHGSPAGIVAKLLVAKVA
jgi:hypothetical protein